MNVGNLVVDLRTVHADTLIAKVDGMKELIESVERLLRLHETGGIMQYEVDECAADLRNCLAKIHGES
jgi:hypothetical protein